MSVYKVLVKGFDSGLNELLASQRMTYDRRIKKYRVFNAEKAKNDKICREWILKAGMRKVKLQTPIHIHYRFFVKDKRHDVSNVVSGFIKSFEDALQELKILKNDGMNDVLPYTFEFYVDRENPRIEVEIREVEEKL